MRSPLDHLASELDYEDSLVDEGGILDGFPLPDDIVEPSIPPSSSEENIGTLPDEKSTLNADIPQPKACTPQKHVRSESQPGPDGVQFPSRATEQRYQRYGHRYNLSNGSIDVGSPNAKPTIQRSGVPPPLKLGSGSGLAASASVPQSAPVPYFSSFSPATPQGPPIRNVHRSDDGAVTSPSSARNQLSLPGRHYRHSPSRSAHYPLPLGEHHPPHNQPQNPSQNQPSQPPQPDTIQPAIFPDAFTGSPSRAPPAMYEDHSLQRPRPTRTHSISRSWDAGEHSQVPSPVYPPVPALSSPEEHVRMGVRVMAFNQDPVLAHRHWEAAASPPFHSKTALLLLVLGHSERWFPPGLAVHPQVVGPGVDIQYVPSSVSLVTHNLPAPTILKDMAGPIFPLVCSGLSEYAAKLLARQLDLEALEFLELCGSLGSAQSLATAANIYYKGSRRVRRDAGRAMRLYERADRLT